MGNRKPYCLFLILALSASIDGISQKNIGNLFVNNQYKGDEMFLDLYYEQAVTYYKLALNKDENNSRLKYKIADSYRLIGDYTSALQWYDQVYNDSSFSGDAAGKLYYANALTSSGRIDEAKLWYEKYRHDAPEDSRVSRNLAELAKNHILYRDSAIVTINSLPFNTEFDELAAVPRLNGLVFLSSRPSAGITSPDYLRTEDPLDLYYVPYDSMIGWGVAKNFGKPINTNYFEGPLTFYDSGSKMMLTRSNLVNGKPSLCSDGKTKLEILTSELVDGRWSEPQPLSFINSEYSYAHPAVNPTGDTLYFASDMAGSYGNSDIYMSTLDEGGWRTPVNLGPVINTEGEELYPYYIQNRLFFSSNGQGGLGGLDIYKAIIEKGVVHRVVNVGYPINSNRDDFAYSIDINSLTGTFSSNRSGGKGQDDVYSYAYAARILTGKVWQEQDGSSISGAVVELFQNGNLIATTTTGSDGLFYFHLPLASDFVVEVSKETYRSSMPVKLSSDYRSVDLDTLNISLHKQDLFARGRVLNNETQELMPDVRVILHNLTDNVLDTLFTDATGLYSFALNADKQYSIWAGKAGFLVGGVDINTLRIARGEILNDIVLELEYSRKNVVHFDYDKHNLKPEAIVILNKVVKVMRNGQNKLVISAYADARGTVEYNQALSDRRAEEVRQFFIAKGVAASRITARGFGETLLLNRCTDGVDCAEVEHSANRRAEVKIEGSTVK